LGIFGQTINLHPDIGSILEQRPFSRELVACDPTGLTTLAIPLQPDQGVLLLGTLVVLDGTRALLPSHAVGILSMTVNTDGMPQIGLTQFTRGADLVGEL